jgi:hypothetical protein
MTLSTAINLGLAAQALLNPGAVFGGAAVSKTVDRTTTTVDSTTRTVDRA